MRFIPVCIFFLAFVSCNKDNDNNNGTDTPSTINITLPASGIIATNGSALRVEGEISDIDGLSTARVEIRNKTTNAIYNQQSSTTGNVSFYRFAWTWNVTGITSATQARVTVIARDRFGREVSKYVDITLDN